MLVGEAAHLYEHHLLAVHVAPAGGAQSPRQAGSAPNANVVERTMVGEPDESASRVNVVLAQASDVLGGVSHFQYVVDGTPADATTLFSTWKTERGRNSDATSNSTKIRVSIMCPICMSACAGTHGQRPARGGV